MNRPSHLEVFDCDGNLYDTRKKNWHLNPPLRRNYQYTHLRIHTTAQLKATLRNGRFADGGYPLYFVTSDGEALSFEAARKNFRLIAEAIKASYNSRWRSGWRIVATATNWEDPALYCSHSNERIPSAYAEDEALENTNE